MFVITAHLRLSGNIQLPSFAPCLQPFVITPYFNNLTYIQTPVFNLFIIPATFTHLSSPRAFMIQFANLSELRR